MAATRDYLGMQWAGGELRLVALRANQASAHVLGGARLSPAEAVQGRTLRKLAPKAMASASALPLDQATIRSLSLPPTTPENLDRIVHLEAEQVLPLATDDLCLGYHVLGMTDQSRLEVLLVAARQEFVREAIERVQPPGGPPVATVDPVCVFNALVHDGEIGKEEDLAFCVLEPGQAQLALVSQGRLIAARPFVPEESDSGGSSLAREIRLSLAAMSQQLGREPRRLLLCGSRAAAAVSRLAAELDLPVELAAPRGLLAAGLSPEEAAGFVPAYGAALQAAGRCQIPINLTPARLVTERYQMRTRQIAFSWGALIASMVIAALLVGFAAVYAREREASRLQATVRRLGGSVAADGASAEALAQSYSNALAAVRQATSAAQLPSKVLAGLMEDLPPGVWLAELAFNSRTGARVRGYALDPSGPQAALVALHRRAIFHEVTLNYVKQETYEKTPVWAFEFTCRLPRPEETR